MKAHGIYNYRNNGSFFSSGLSMLMSSHMEQLQATRSKTAIKNQRHEALGITNLGLEELQFVQLVELLAIAGAAKISLTRKTLYNSLFTLVLQQPLSQEKSCLAQVWLRTEGKGKDQQLGRKASAPPADVTFIPMHAPCPSSPSLHFRTPNQREHCQHIHHMPGCQSSMGTTRFHGSTRPTPQRREEGHAS
jgi:hypothetical protein